MKTPVTHDQMIKMFASQQDTILEFNKLMQTSINATTKAETDRIDVKLDGVITRQDDQNGRVAENGNKIAKIEKTTGFVIRVRKNAKWITLGLFGFCYIVAWIYHNIDIFELVKTLILNKL